VRHLRSGRQRLGVAGDRVRERVVPRAARRGVRLRRRRPRVRRPAPGHSDRRGRVRRIPAPHGPRAGHPAARDRRSARPRHPEEIMNRIAFLALSLAFWAAPAVAQDVVINRISNVLPLNASAGEAWVVADPANQDKVTVIWLATQNTGGTTPPD